MHDVVPNRTSRVRTHPPFECIALLLQGGGALVAYQAGVYQALAEADLHPDWVAGISIGAINSAIIAGDLAEVATRQKEIQYSSRTRANTDQFKRLQRMRSVLATLLEKLPNDLKASEEAKMLRSAADHNGLQHRAPHLPLEALRAPLEGLRVLVSHDGGSLARWIPRRGAHAAASVVRLQYYAR